MIQVLASISGGSVVLLVALVGWLTYRAIGAMRDQLAMRDLLDAEREQHRKTRGELDVETAAHAVTRDELGKENALRMSAESERNQAYLQGREDAVTIIRNANVGDANHLVGRILAAPLPGLPQAVPEGRATAPGPDRLENPFVQPATGS